MKNRIRRLAVLALCTNFQATIAFTNSLVAMDQGMPDDRCEMPELSDYISFEADTCYRAANFVIPIIGGVVSLVFASGIFVLLELRWHLRE